MMQPATQSGRTLEERRRACLSRGPVRFSTPTASHKTLSPEASADPTPASTPSIQNHTVDVRGGQAASQTKPPTSFPFARLPYELQAEICSYAIVENKPIKVGRLLSSVQQAEAQPSSPNGAAGSDGKVDPSPRRRRRPRLVGPEAAPAYHPLYRALFFPSSPLPSPALIAPSPRSAFSELLPALTTAFYVHNAFVVSTVTELGQFAALIGPANTRHLRRLELATASFFACTPLLPVSVHCHGPRRGCALNLDPTLGFLRDSGAFFAGAAAQVFAAQPGALARIRAHHPARLTRCVAALAALPALRAIDLSHPYDLQLALPVTNPDYPEWQRAARRHLASNPEHRVRLFFELPLLAVLGEGVPQLERVGFRLPQSAPKEGSAATDRSFINVYASRKRDPHQSPPGGETPVEFGRMTWSREVERVARRNVEAEADGLAALHRVDPALREQFEQLWRIGDDAHEERVQAERAERETTG